MAPSRGWSTVPEGWYHRGRWPGVVAWPPVGDDLPEGWYHRGRWPGVLAWQDSGRWSTWRIVSQRQVTRGSSMAPSREPFTTFSSNSSRLLRSSPSWPVYAGQKGYYAGSPKTWYAKESHQINYKGNTGTVFEAVRTVYYVFAELWCHHCADEISISDVNRHKTSLAIIYMCLKMYCYKCTC